MKLFPRSFFWRTALMIVVPLIIVQLIMSNVFFGNHWGRIHALMANTLSSEIATMISLMDSGNMSAMETLAKNSRINMSVNAKLNRPKRDDNDSREVGHLAANLKERIKEPVSVYVDRGNRLLFVDVPRDGKIVTFATSLRRVYSTSTDVFAIWLVASALLVTILVSPFVIMHTRSITRIAKAAGRFGRGLDAPGFKPSGSKEIREAAHALITMKERLNRYNRTRTDMLNAVSHDLKTPLTRMRLSVETDSAVKKVLLRDIDRMTDMVNGYLAFARGEIPEIEQEIALPAMLMRIARDDAPDKKIATNFPENPVMFYARPTALARAFQNIVANAAQYAKSKIEITETDSSEQITIIIDDDGPGIPVDKRADALRPFVRLDGARSDATGGTGLGLSIAQTAIENHGGQILLEDSPLGGLRVRVVLPI
ncbi:MAG: ATP-binding protein [Alphaproteobacteria bacterium]|nr:ATP-binding protein [Alphaproteobacteria bacterium]